MPIGITVLPQIFTVGYEELEGSRQCGSTTRPAGMFTGTMAFKVAWADRHTFRQQVLGGMSNAGESQIYRLPLLYPEIDFAAAHEAFIAPLTTSNGTTTAGNLRILDYEFAKITVNFASRASLVAQNNPQIVTVTESLEPSVEFITLPNKKLYWQTGKTGELNIDEAPGAMIRMID